MQKTNLFLRKKVFINQTLLISFINFFFGKQTKVCFFLANRVGCRLCIRSYTLLHIIRSPRGSVSAFHSCSLCIYGVAFHTVWGFCLFSNISHATPPCIQFLSLGSNVCRQLPLDSQSLTKPLRLG